MTCYQYIKIIIVFSAYYTPEQWQVACHNYCHASKGIVYIRIKEGLGDKRRSPQGQCTDNCW